MDDSDLQLGHLMHEQLTTAVEVLGLVQSTKPDHLDAILIGLPDGLCKQTIDGLVLALQEVVDGVTWHTPSLRGQAAQLASNGGERLAEVGHQHERQQRKRVQQPCRPPLQIRPRTERP
eukprot:scaffold4868_cov416-Prasinococcus_capsulatus_cf.AAC.3